MVCGTQTKPELSASTSDKKCGKYNMELWINGSMDSGWVEWSVSMLSGSITKTFLYTCELTGQADGIIVHIFQMYVALVVLCDSRLQDGWHLTRGQKHWQLNLNKTTI